MALTLIMKPIFSLTRTSTLWFIAFLFTMLVYIAGLWIPVMEPDAAVYAEVSMEMLDRHDFLSIFHKGQDWLDKPHFPFWMSAISYKIFGVNAFAYKLPGVLFVLLGGLYTYRFASRYYSPLHGWISALILLTAQHIIISNQDVRAEPFMTGLLIMALYHFAVFVDEKKFIDLALGSLGLACLMMTKGLFTILPVGAGIGLSLLIQKTWKKILDWRWLIAVVLTVVFLSPALYGYYRQFDMHPEKTVFGEHHVSGVKFFLWTSQWGRFTNTGPIKGKGDLFFFVHTMIWAFLPWAFLAFFALFVKTKALIRRTNRSENYTYFGFISLFLVFSLSRFQLSFYLNPLFPLLSVVTTAVLLDQNRRTIRVFSIMHLVVCSLLIVALSVLHYFFFNHWPHGETIAILILGFGLGFYLFTRKGIFLKKILFATVMVTLSVNYYINRDFYPALLDYQAESRAGEYFIHQGLDAGKLVFAGEVQSAADIVLHRTTPIIAIDDLTAGNVAGKYVFTSPQGKAKMDSLGLSYAQLSVFPDFPVTRLNGKFINKKTRGEAVEPKYLLKVAQVK
jgi:4-amino-4-deoxy-L-arabinose transferase-like glycosyltransferase